jgi:tetratricopeptide (TPR) repeat protein
MVACRPRRREFAGDIERSTMQIAQVVLGVVLSSAILWPASVRAQSSSDATPPLRAPRDESTEARVAKARMHFVLGMQFFEVRAFRDAIREFEQATELAPSADVWFNIGRAREELGEDEQAKRAFERYLRDRVDAPDAEAVRARIAMIDQRIRTGARIAESSGGAGSLRIHLPERWRGRSLAGQVSLDGKAIRESQRAQPIILPAGRHRLEVKRTGYVPFRSEISIEPGMLTAAYPRLDPLTEASRGDEAESRGWTWVALGVAGAGAIGTGILAGIAVDRQSDGNVTAARSWARRADAALIGTSVCALAAALLYFAEGPPRTPSSTATERTAEHAQR